MLVAPPDGVHCGSNDSKRKTRYFLTHYVNLGWGRARIHTHAHMKMCRFNDNRGKLEGQVIA